MKASFFGICDKKNIERALKYKNVAVSTWGRQSMSYRKYGATTLKALIGDLTNIIPDTYTTKKAIETEMEKR